MKEVALMELAVEAEVVPAASVGSRLERDERAEEWRALGALRGKEPTRSSRQEMGAERTSRTACSLVVSAVSSSF